jgi:hypothetical protein
MMQIARLPKGAGGVVRVIMVRGLEYGIYSVSGGINSVLQNRYTITCTTLLGSQVGWVMSSLWKPMEVLKINWLSKAKYVVGICFILHETSELFNPRGSQLFLLQHLLGIFAHGQAEVIRTQNHTVFGAN